MKQQIKNPKPFHLYIDNVGNVKLYIGQTHIGTHIFYSIVTLVLKSEYSNEEASKIVGHALNEILGSKIRPEKVRNIMHSQIPKIFKKGIGKADKDKVRNWIIKNNLFGGNALMNEALEDKVIQKINLEEKDLIIGKMYYLPTKEFRLGKNEEYRDLAVYFGKLTNQLIFIQITANTFERIYQMWITNKLEYKTFKEIISNSIFYGYDILRYSELPEIFELQMFRDIANNFILDENALNDIYNNHNSYGDYYIK